MRSMQVKRDGWRELGDSHGTSKRPQAGSVLSSAQTLVDSSESVEPKL
jgi:hypothetical protein